MSAGSADERLGREVNTATEAAGAMPLDVARKCFIWLVTGPKPLTVDCRGLAGLPHRAVPLDELLERLLHGRCPRETKDAVWRTLVLRSRAEGAPWTLACIGMARPALVRIAKRLAARCPGEGLDVHAEVLSGFLGALSTIDVDRPGVLVRLNWAAYRRGLAALREVLDAPTPVGSRFESVPPRPPWGHPDLLLANAVRAGVLTRTEADLIGSTRLDKESVSGWALAHGRTRAGVYKARQRAERRLVDFLLAGVRSDGEEEPVADAVLTGLMDSASDSGRAGPPEREASTLQPSPSVTTTRVEGRTALQAISPAPCPKARR
ncbi:hypothetical protein [Streptomyces sp. NPDC059009]|uniref:hypothetical protein n=1 Tax=Streptomyces sp. NPDC059009 TaxID=3346694 RepID=UPI003698FF19